MVILFSTHRHIGHIVFVSFFVIQKEIKGNKNYVSYVSMC
jgi:hypothetical protein